MTFIFPAQAASTRFELDLPQAPLLGDRIDFEGGPKHDAGLTFQVARITWRLRREGDDPVRRCIAELAIVERPTAKVVPLRPVPFAGEEF